MASIEPPEEEGDGDDGIGDKTAAPEPLRVFGTGLHRKKIAFVPATSGAAEATADHGPGAVPRASGKAVAEAYLSLVLPGREEARGEGTAPSPPVCDVCKLPLHLDSEKEGNANANMHAALLAHQVCLAHSRPPYAGDRSSVGFAVLEAHGWDPNRRPGLGPDGHGIRFPLKPKPKDDKLGLGLTPARPRQPARARERPKLLDAKRARKMAADDRTRTEALHRQLFGNPDVERYLGKGN